MLLGTHPIPARSPAEREGQKRKEMGGREGGREEDEEEEGWGILDGEWGSVGRMIGGEREKVGFWEDDGYSREERENGGITCYVNEREWFIRENNQQFNNGYIRSRQCKIVAAESMPICIKVGGENTD